MILEKTEGIKMSFNREIQEKINRFAKEQSQHYLHDAEMTYMERLHRKSGQAKQKMIKNLARFKGQSDKGVEAQNDMIVYMNDYMNDLLSQGLSEQEAYDKASEEMKFASDTEQSADLSERFQQYYANIDPSEYEMIGLFYGGFMFIGLVVGGLIGYLLSGGRLAFLGGGWIDVGLGVVTGLIIGLGAGLICHGVISVKLIDKRWR